MFIRKVSGNQIIRKKTNDIKNPKPLTQKIKSENKTKQNLNIHRTQGNQCARDRLGGKDHCSDPA